MAKRLQLLFLDLRQAEQLSQRYERLSADLQSLGRLCGVSGRSSCLLGQDLFNHLVELLKDVQNEQVQVP